MTRNALDGAAAGVHDVVLNGVTFRCRVDGTPGAPWIVFSNSLATSLSLWDRQVAALGASFRTLRYDQRGHGHTGLPPGGCTFDLLVDDVTALCDAFAIDRATVVGVSMGAVTALRLAARLPDRVSGVVAADGQWAAPKGGAEVWDARIRVAADAGMDALVEPTVSRWFTPATVAANPPVLDRVRGMIRDTPPDGYIACARALQHYDFRDDFSRIRVPVLLVVGAADGALPVVMREMQQAIPGSSLVEIAGAVHLPNIEQPEVFDAAIVPFVRGCAGSATTGP